MLEDEDGTVEDDDDDDDVVVVDIAISSIRHLSNFANVGAVKCPNVRSNVIGSFEYSDAKAVAATVNAAGVCDFIFTRNG